LEWQKNSKTKEANVFFSLFSCLPARKLAFWAQKREKVTNGEKKDEFNIIGSKIFASQLGRCGYLKNLKFYSDFKMEEFTFVASSYTNLEPKKSFRKKTSSSKIGVDGANF
jgi:hypothetical protein